MDNVMLLAETSGHPATEAAESVPYVVQTASSGSLRLIGLALVVMMFILALLTVILICIEMRQDTLRKMIHSMAKRLERMEKRMLEESSEDKTEYVRSVAGTRRNVNKASSVSSGGQTTSVTAKTKNTEVTSYDTGGNNKARTISVADEYYEHDDSAVSGKKTSFLEHTTLAPPEKPYPLCGLIVNSSSHYNQYGHVNFDEVPAQEALFILYSNMTVKPNNRQFNVFNNASYYANHDFTMIFDFEDKEGYPIDMKHHLKCLKVTKVASVINSQNGYILNENGIILAEER